MEHSVNIALQIIPFTDDKHPYLIVDKAIEVIQQSGLVYRVCPFETVMEGPYEKIMEVVKKAQEACYEAGAGELITFIKIQSAKGRDVTISDKMEKYD